MYRLLIFILFVALSVNLSAQQNWIVQLVDPGGGLLNFDTSIDVDSLGHPHIAYAYGYLAKYAKWNGISWEFQLVDTLGFLKDAIKLCLDRQGIPHIGYARCLSNWRYYLYTFWNGFSWQTEAVDSFFSTQPTIPLGERSLDFSLSRNGIPFLTYPFINLLDSTWEVRCAWRDTHRWRITTISKEPSLSWPTFRPRIALDTAGHPHIIFDGRYRSWLYYAYYDGDTWEITQVDSGGGLFIIPYSIKIDESNKIHIAYQSGGEVFYAVSQDTGWHIELAGYNGLSMAFGDFAINREGPHIVNSASFAFPAYFYKDTIWHEELIEDWHGLYPSIAVDRYGVKHVSYSRGWLYYARRISSGIEEEYSMRDTTALQLVICPNPTKSKSVIRYTILSPPPELSTIKGVDFSKVSLQLYDISGREIKTLIDERKTPGNYFITLNTKTLSSGMYFLSLQSESKRIIKRFIVIK